MTNQNTAAPWPDRFWEKVDRRGPDECWEWKAGKDIKGYGKIRHSMAHRVAYELLKGPITAGLTIDHTCRNRGCVNPAHLEPVTNAENIRRGASVSTQNRLKTHCPRGHEYTPENTKMTSAGRSCRECDRLRKRGDVRCPICGHIETHANHAAPVDRVGGEGLDPKGRLARVARYVINAAHPSSELPDWFIVRFIVHGDDLDALRAALVNDETPGDGR